MSSRIARPIELDIDLKIVMRVCAVLCAVFGQIHFSKIDMTLPHELFPEKPNFCYRYHW